MVTHFTGEALIPQASELDDKVGLRDVVTAKHSTSLSAGMAELKPGASFKWPYVYDEVVYVIEGVFQVTTEDGKTINGAAGDIVYINTGDIVTISSGKGCKSIWVTHPNWNMAVEAAEKFKANT